MQRLIVGIGAMGLIFGMASIAPAAEQATKGGGARSDASGQHGQMRSTDASAPSDRDAHLGPQQDKGGKAGQRSSGEASQRMSPGDSGAGGKQGGKQDPIEQQQTGPGSGKSSGVGAGQ
jgi:hypothetical protein